jgi:hypothetical protein
MALNMFRMNDCKIIYNNDNYKIYFISNLNTLQDNNDIFIKRSIQEAFLLSVIRLFESVFHYINIILDVAHIPS